MGHHWGIFLAEENHNGQDRNSHDRFYQMVAGNSSDAAVELDRGGAIGSMNAAVSDVFGVDASATVGKPLSAIVHEASAELLTQKVAEHADRVAKKAPAFRERFSVEGRHVSGRVIPLEVTLQGYGSPEEPRVLALFRDLSHRQRISETVRAAAESYSALSEATSDAIVQISEDLQIIYANSAARTMFGREKGELAPSDFSVLFPPAEYQRYREHFRKYFMIDDAHRKERKLANVMEVLGRRKDRGVFPLEISFGNSRNVLGERILTCIMRDITERKRTARKLKFLAYHDKLTELGNRDLLYESLRSYLSRVEQGAAGTGALLFLDLDGFKKINDTLGHEAGDQILKEAATRIGGCLRESDLVYRYTEEADAAEPNHEEVFRFGGDEFVILLTQLRGRDDAGAVAERILDVVAEPYDLIAASTALKGNLGVSIGIAMIPDDGTDAMELIQCADVAMYKAKETRNSYVYFTPELHQKNSQRLELESGLRAAIKNEQLSIAYQALVNAKGEVLGAEALLRWNHPTLGAISPAEFIPLAEDTGLIVPIGSWVLRAVCQQLAAWNAGTLPDFYVSVNLSAKQFNQPGMVEQLTAIIRESGANPANLKLEVTESCLLEDPGEARRRMEQIKEENAGIRIAIDDFGAGYSSLSYLSDLPVDMLKIDQSFVANLYTSRHNPKIVNTILALAFGLHLDVIAEGVETKEQLHYLATKDCTLFQGFYFAKPMPAAELEKMIGERKTRGRKADK
jgi:PAS domain S-box-containing protein